MKVHEAIQMLETLPAGASVNWLALEAAHERGKEIKKNELEKNLSEHATRAMGYEGFLTASRYMQSVYVNAPASWNVRFDDAYSYVYVDCGGFFDIYNMGPKEAVIVEVKVDGN